jgi:hypothetical protein
MTIYELYGETPSGRFTTRSIAYSRGTHPYVVSVRAVTIKQAYYLAYNGEHATDDSDSGIVDVWSNGRPHT